MGRMNKKAQSSLFDMVFFIPLLILAGLILSFSTVKIYENTVKDDEKIVVVAETLENILRVTIDKATYSASGATILLEDQSVLELLFEDLYLRDKGVADVSSIVQGIETKINTTVRTVVSPEYHYNLTASYKNINIWLSDYGASNQLKYTATEYFKMPYEPTNVMKVTLVIWLR
ncbi:MAG: hypothetical protein QW531_04125 [Thermoplasmata archaeon]